MEVSNKRQTFSVKPHEDGFVVLRGDEVLRTPRNIEILVPTRRLAEAISGEFSEQGGKFDLRKMPLTQMALTSIDIASFNRDDLINGVMRIGANDLLCLRAEDSDGLLEEQGVVWQPYLDWCKEKFDATLDVSKGGVSCYQSAEALSALRQAVEKMDHFSLTGLSEASSLSGSLVLGLALARGRVDAAAFFGAAELECLWQSKKWGEDPSVQNRHAEIMRDAEMLALFFELLR